MSDQERNDDAAKQAAFENQASTLLRASVDNLDAATRSRLTRARHAALEAAKQPRTIWFRWALPTGATAAVIVAVVLATHAIRSDVPSAEQIVAAQPAQTVEDLELIASEDSLEFYREIEFYAWLDTALEEESRTSDVARESEAS